MNTGIPAGTSAGRIAVALVHYPVLNRKGETSVTAITTLDVHDFARSCAFYGVEPVYLVHPATGMRAMVEEMLDYWLQGAGAGRNPSRGETLKSLRLVESLEEARDEGEYQLWYTSADADDEASLAPEKLNEIQGRHLIVFGTGSGLDRTALPEPNGWLSPIKGIGRVRHLSVRAALAIYLDRLQPHTD